MSNIFNFFKGIFIGAGAILPGISSGVLCVIFGIYETLLDKVLNFFKNPIQNFKFLFSLIFGGIIGVFLVGKLLLYLFHHFYIPTCFCFIGLILGCVPSILKQVKQENKVNFLHYLCLIFTFTFSLYLVALEFSHPTETNVTPVSNIFLGISGFLMSAGVVIPGVSSSVILMISGVYELYLGAIANLNLYILVPMGIGLIIGGFLFLKLIQFLFQHFKSYTYYAIIGFTLGSVLVLYPGFEFNLYGFISIVLAMLCFGIARLFEKF